MKLTHLILVLTLLIPTLTRADNPNRIQPYAENPHYWQYNGKPVLLLGGSDEDNLFQFPELIKQLDTLQKAGGNYVRNTMSSRDEGEVWQFAKVDGKYDLDQWNPEYWERFETFLQETAKRDIIVQIELWATFDYYLQYWDGNPFNPKNNSTYTPEDSKLRNRIKSHPLQLENNFFRALPDEMDIPIVFKYQKKFIDNTKRLKRVITRLPGLRLALAYGVTQLPILLQPQKAMFSKHPAKEPGRC